MPDAAEQEQVTADPTPEPEPVAPPEAEPVPDETQDAADSAKERQPPPPSDVPEEAHDAQVRRLLRDASDVTSPARYQWEAEQVQALRQTVARDCSPAEFVMFLEIAARYKLDPFAKQIWAVRMSEKPTDPVVIMVGRDGLMSIAERHSTFEGMRSGEVVVGDKLSIDERGHYVHEWGENHLTGAVIGAWCEVYRSDRAEPTQFYARVSEYAKATKIWQKYKTAMILKCAQATALRMAFSISGVVVEEEVGGVEPAGMLSEPTTINWGDDPLLAQWLKALVNAANEAKPNSYRERKLLVLLRGRDTEELKTFAQEVSMHVVAQKGLVPDPPPDLHVEVAADGQLLWEIDGESRIVRQVVGSDEDRPAEPEPEDAEVVDDGEPQEDPRDASNEKLTTL
jgi:phage recombination protein Bet